jgi:hypothetical protein
MFMKSLQKRCHAFKARREIHNIVRVQINNSLSNSKDIAGESSAITPLLKY